MGVSFYVGGKIRLNPHHMSETGSQGSAGLIQQVTVL